MGSVTTRLYTVLHAQVKQVSEDKVHLTQLLDRLCTLKEMHIARGIVALCENCQQPLEAEELPSCAAAEGL